MVGSVDSETRSLRVIDGGGGTDDSSMADLGWNIRRSGWFDRVRKQLTPLPNLKVGWDGHGALPISVDTAFFAYQALNEVYRRGLPVPDISPMPDESIMVEWLVNGVEFTLEVHGIYDVTYIFEREGDDEPRCGMASQDFRNLDRFVCAVIEATREINAAA
jgi:hypothetical protein